LAGARAPSSISTVAVIPAERTTSGGTSSILDAHRDALRQAYPGEDRVDSRHPLIVGLRVRDVDRACDAVDAAAQHLTMAHQFDLSPIAHADGSEIVSSKYPSTQNESASTSEMAFAPTVT
jgi:hypothetical protein